MAPINACIMKTNFLDVSDISYVLSHYLWNFYHVIHLKHLVFNGLKIVKIL